MRTPPPRLLLIIGVALTGLVAIALVMLSVAGVLDPIAAIQIAASVALLSTMAVLAFSLRRTDGKAQRIDARIKRQDAVLARTEQGLTRLTATVTELARRIEDAGRDQTRTVLSALGEDRVELTGQAERLAELGATLSRVDAVVRHSAAEVDHLDLAVRQDQEKRDQALRDVRARLDMLGGSIRDGRAELTRSTRQDYAQLEALIDLRALIQPRAPLPRLRGWAASPDVLRLLVERMAMERTKIVVECGSGSSSVWLGYAAQRFGAGRVIALEHDPRFAETTRDLVLAHGLQDVVEVRHAPLASLPMNGETFPWYDAQAVADLTDIGLVFVDGPPGGTAPLARYPAVPVLLPRCAADAWFVLDDADRPAERAIVERWLREHPELTGHSRATEKGAMLLRRSPQ